MDMSCRGAQWAVEICGGFGRTREVAVLTGKVVVMAFLQIDSFLVGASLRQPRSCGDYDEIL